MQSVGALMEDNFRLHDDMIALYLACVLLHVASDASSSSCSRSAAGQDCMRAALGPPMLEIPEAHSWDVAAHRMSVELERALRAKGGGRTVKDLLPTLPIAVATDKHVLADPKPLRLSSKESWGWPFSLLGSRGEEREEAVQPSPPGDRGGSHKPYSCSLSLVQEACRAYAAQASQPVRAPPRGEKGCPGGCNGVGNCHHDLGLCMCPAGWTGPTCEAPLKRPCTNAYRSLKAFDPLPISHIDAVTKHDLNWSAAGWTASRCAGYCNDDVAACYCGQDSKYAHVPAPKGSPAGTPPVRVGRPMVDPCKPGTDEQGRPARGEKAGSSPAITWDHMYGGEKAWCNAIPGSDVAKR